MRKSDTTNECGRTNFNYKSTTGRAISYALNQEEYLRVFLHHGDVPMENNAALCEGITYPHLRTEDLENTGFQKKRCG